MELFWTPEATQDREEIFDYIEADNPAAALALDELFAEKAGRLVDHPGLGRPSRVAGARELVAHQNTSLSTTRPAIWCECCAYCTPPDSGRQECIKHVTSKLDMGQNQQLEMGLPKIWDLQLIKFRKAIYSERVQVV